MQTARVGKIDTNLKRRLILPGWGAVFIATVEGNYLLSDEKKLFGLKPYLKNKKVLMGRSPVELIVLINGFV